MESFVPLGGFFSSPCELKGQLSGSYQFTSRCHQCNEKCEQEVAALSKGGFTASVADQYQPNLPAWLQMAELGKSTAFDVAKVCISFKFISETFINIHPYHNSKSYMLLCLLTLVMANFKCLLWTKVLKSIFLMLLLAHLKQLFLENVWIGFIMMVILWPKRIPYWWNHHNIIYSVMLLQ